MKAILSVVGARPNFVKLAPLDRELRRRGIRHVIVHTGQHYDASLSDDFFRDLAIPAPDHNLGVGSGTHTQQTAEIMRRFEPVLIRERPDLVLVYGDVNSTMAAALVGAKLGLPVGHVEAGLRSRDWRMPEEVNRVVTDRLSQLLFTPSRDADQNLLAEGVPAQRIHFVGNIMIDSLLAVLPHAKALAAPARFDVRVGEYALVTLHRPSNVDDPQTLRELLAGLEELTARGPVLFPLHPRTRRRLDEFGLDIRGGNGLRFIEPVGYVEMLSLITGAGLVITDSGGVQEETSYLGIPCLTARPNTERPITVHCGTNTLIESSRRALVTAALEAWGRVGQRAPIELWDGRTAHRIAEVVCA